MTDFYSLLDKFLLQAQTSNLKRQDFPREWVGFEMKVSFGQGNPARIPWIAFLGDGMSVSDGIYPVYLYYKSKKTLILSYGISETYEPSQDWPYELVGDLDSIRDSIDKDVFRYGNSIVYKTYNVEIEKNNVNLTSQINKKSISPNTINSDLKGILSNYSRVVSNAPIDPSIFHLERQLEDFLLENWNSISLGENLDLIIEDGELKSQQYRTEIGPIDILARTKDTKEYVVLELKKDQTSDQTVGQILRYIGWVRDNLAKGKPVKGIIIAGKFDKKLEYAIKGAVGLDIDFYLYKIDFDLEKQIFS